MGLFGDIPSWLDYAEQRKARKRDADRAEEQDKRAQASRLSAWIEKRNTEDGYYDLGICICNSSDLPVHNLQIIAAFGKTESPFTTRPTTCPPGNSFIEKRKPWDKRKGDFEFLTHLDSSDAGRYEPYAASERFKVFAVIFKDSASIWWCQDDSGLREIPAVTEPLHWSSPQKWCTCLSMKRGW